MSEVAVYALFRIVAPGSVHLLSIRGKGGVTQALNFN